MLKLSLLLLCLLLVMPAQAKKHTFAFKGRKFTLVTANRGSNANKPLLVLLHGCKQSSNIILEGTQLEKAAQENGFLILAPEQGILENIDHCWNWFMDHQQDRRSFNEMGQIIGAIELVIQRYQTNREQTYLAGISAGGVMAHNLTACYPDYFQGAAIHAGLAYKVAENIMEAQTVLTASQLKSPNYLGRKAYECGRVVSVRRLSKMILIHGMDDKRVDPFHSELISKTNEVMLDYIDDGRRNDSIKIIKRESVRNFPKGYSAQLTEKTFTGQNFTERTILMSGLAHAWGGGKAVSENFDINAPSSNELILNFFQLKR